MAVKSGEEAVNLLAAGPAHSPREQLNTSMSVTVDIFFKRVHLGGTLMPHESRSYGAATSTPRTYNLAPTREVRLHSPMVPCVKQTPNEDRPLLIIADNHDRYHISRSKDVGAGVQAQLRDTRLSTAHHFHHTATGRARPRHAISRALPPPYRALVLTITRSTGTLFGRLWNCDERPTFMSFNQPARNTWTCSALPAHPALLAMAYGNATA
jgi:hypothetical protein